MDPILLRFVDKEVDLAYLSKSFQASFKYSMAVLVAFLLLQLFFLKRILADDLHNFAHIIFIATVQRALQCALRAYLHYRMTDQVKN